MFCKAGSLQQVAVSQQITRDVIPATRGTITDSNGVELALSESADKVVADDFLIKHPATVAAQLAPLLDEPLLTVEAQLSKRDGYVPLAYLLPADAATADHQAADQRDLRGPRGHPRVPARLVRLAAAGLRTP